VNIAEYRDAISDTSVVFLKDRLPIFWGGFNVVLAEIALLRAALDHGEYIRLILISDSSIPIKRPIEICRELYQDDLWIGQHTQPYAKMRYEGFFYFDSLATNPLHIPIEHRQLGFREIDNINKLADLRKIGKLPIRRVLHGPLWWCLTRDAVEAILLVHKSNDRLRESFRFSALPEEQYIHTIIGSMTGGWNFRDSHMYFDISRIPKPYVFSSYDDIKIAMATDFLFLEKMAADEALIELVVSALAA
jgi:hypothetical protein